MVKARYSIPTKPLQLTYADEGMIMEFILMTIGDYRGASATPSVVTVAAGKPSAGNHTKRPASRQPLEATSSTKRLNTSEMPPPPILSRTSTTNSGREAVSRKDSRPSPPPPQQSAHSQALFHPEEDEDRRWDPVNYDEDQAEELMWDTGVPHVSQLLPVDVPFSNRNQASATINSGGVDGRAEQAGGTPTESATKTRTNTGFEKEESLTVPTQRLMPTQRLSDVSVTIARKICHCTLLNQRQVRGIFD